MSNSPTFTSDMLTEIILEDFLGPFLCWEVKTRKLNSKATNSGVDVVQQEKRSPIDEKEMRSEKREEVKKTVEDSKTDQKSLRNEIQHIKNASSRLFVENENWKNVYGSSRKDFNEGLEIEEEMLMAQAKSLEKDLDAMQSQLDTILRKQVMAQGNEAKVIRI